jgi:uncharacterized protein (TIGR00269 family)
MISIEEKVKRTISKYSLLDHGDKIALAVSGGKDSLSLLYILNGMCKTHGSEIHAVTVDEGISNYREEAVDLSRDFSRKLGIPHRIISFKEIYGLTLEEILDSGEINKKNSCTCCGILRRRAIDIASQDLKVDKIVTAHNLDDFLQTFFINLLNSDMRRLEWLSPYHQSESEFAIRRVKPLMEVFEKEVAMYAFLRDIPFQSQDCPYTEGSIRSEIRQIISNLESNHPGISNSTLSSALKVSGNISGKPEKTRLCKVCRSPSSNDVCSVCTILDRVKESIK